MNCRNCGSFWYWSPVFKACLRCNYEERDYMLLTVCAVRDAAVDAFMRPFCVPTVGMAVRSFQDEVKDPQSPMAKHPGDYELFQLGVFDEDTGKFENAVAPRSLARASDYVKEV